MFEGTKAIEMLKCVQNLTLLIVHNKLFVLHVKYT